MAQLRQCQAGPTHESSGPVLAVVAGGPAELAVITELSGEGSTWLHLLRLRLDATGER